MEKKYQFCLIDPEGDYENLPGSRTVGDEKRPPSIKQVQQALDAPEAQIIVNLVAISAADRPAYFASLISEIQALRLRTGRPHWLVVDEAHHVFPSEWAPASAEMAEELCNLLLVTVHPEHVSPMAIRRINTVIVVGREPGKLIDEFVAVRKVAVPELKSDHLQRGTILAR
ncbi:MAG: hypothetical protein JO091_15160, partial [Acidobacteriaceae bacterium]|nr:hypothetical protein [Acidobacteriaceae bacterium]